MASPEWLRRWARDAGRELAGLWCTTAPGSPLRLRSWDLAFVVAWVVCTGVLVAPLWVGSMTPLRDFGSHVTMAEVWTHYDENAAYQDVFSLRTGFFPNLLAVRFASLVSPLLGPLAAVRLFVSLALVTTSVSLLWVLRTYGGSRWQVFVGLPFFWGGMLGLGLVNYVAAFPLMLVGLVLGRRAGERGGHGVAIGLGVLGFAAYLVHGLAFVFVSSLSGLALLLSLTRVRNLVYGAAFAPAAGVWLWWMLRLRDREQLGNPVDADETGFSTADLDPMQNLHWFLRQTMDISLEHVDTAVFCMLCAAWIVLLATSSGRASVGESGALRRLRDELRQHAMLVIAMVLGAGCYFLPAYVNEVAINSRLFTPFCLALAVLPRSRPEQSWLAAGAIGLAMAGNLWLGLHLVRSMAVFHDRELAPIEALLEDVPAGSHVECVGVRTVESVFFRRPLEQTCHALVQLHTHAYSGSAFASTGHNALRFRNGNPLPSLGNVSWQTNIRTLGWDYLIVRGRHTPPQGNVVERVSVIDADPEADREEWTLYRVAGPRLDDIGDADALIAGGAGGMAGQTWCAEGQAVDAVSVRIDTKARGLGAARAECRTITVGKDRRFGLSGESTSALLFGEGQPKERVRCAEDRVLVGLFGKTNDLIQSVGGLCLPWAAAVEGTRTVEPSRTEALGRDLGEAYELRCPPGTVMRGLVGRGGSLVDAVGPLCAAPTPL